MQKVVFYSLQSWVISEKVRVSVSQPDSFIHNYRNGPERTTGDRNKDRL